MSAGLDGPVRGCGGRGRAVISVRKEQRVVKGHVGGVSRVNTVVARPFVRTNTLRQDDVAAARITLLIWENYSYLVAGGQVLTAAVSALLKHQAHLWVKDNARRPCSMLLLLLLGL